MLVVTIFYFFESLTLQINMIIIRTKSNGGWSFN